MTLVMWSKWYAKLLATTDTERVKSINKDPISDIQDSEDDSEDEETVTGDGTTDDVIRKAKEEAIRDAELKEDYYSIAHTVSEQITSQPTILIGGDLKEYQLKG